MLHHSIFEQAAARPNAEAFSCRDETLSYQSLFEKSAQLAQTLKSLGLQPMDRVGILMGKCADLPVSTYGILMAGGAYVPIDPNAPKSRIEFIIKDCGINILITNRQKRKIVSSIAESPATPLRHIIGLPENTVDNDHISTHSWAQVFQAEKTPPANRIHEDDLAYVMYTSGSTGMPKGLMHTHSSGLAYARYSADLYDVGPSDILGNHAPLHFDISTFEFLTGPYAGAKSVLIPEEDILFPNSLAPLIERERLTFWYSVPLALIQLISSGLLTNVDCSRLRWILFGGEPFPPKYVEQLTKLIPSARLCNVYGPAEVNQCTYYHLPKNFEDSGEAIPIGNIWKGAQALVVTPDGTCPQADEPGELLISSPTIMKGYWGREDLNKKSFHYEEPIPGFVRRYYRTGDIVSTDKDGGLHFIGRKDRQVKIRGNRIELDEVEAVFATQEQVLEAAAVVIESNEEKQIVVYVSLQGKDPFDPALSLERARMRLPRYGVPQRLEILTVFPRTTSGKIDRKKLVTQYASQPINQSV
ncbi:AMP-binding enzyme, putative [Verrucomicrobiia bacterium DG1235]|nr:AMP-binding enzyme, putative [Verrucomicrobiae bacterium DG1235]